jgi:hypothetical protein
MGVLSGGAGLAHYAFRLDHITQEIEKARVSRLDRKITTLSNRIILLQPHDFCSKEIRQLKEASTYFNQALQKRLNEIIVNAAKQGAQYIRRLQS